MNESIKDKLKNLPDKPGVYIMKDVRGDVIYVGKAVSLKNRVRQYFQNAQHDDKVIAMVRNIEDFHYIITASEMEALTLESNLIKFHRPRYNILLKDDKHFPYVRIQTRAPFPRVEVVRRVQNDNAKYFGPYLSTFALHDAIEAVRENFPLRTCKKDIEKAIERRERPCLNAQIGKCVAPCSGAVTKEDYAELVQEVLAFLAGQHDTVLAGLKKQMEAAAGKLDFERAAWLRDRIASIQAIGEKQRAIAANLDERDVLAFARSGADAIIYALFIRGGKLVGAEHFAMIAPDEESGEVMKSFLQQFYAQSADIPAEIVLHEPTADAAALEAWLGEKRGSRVHLVHPQRGDKKKLAEMAFSNASETLQKQALSERREWERHEGAVSSLASILGISKPPVRIEAFDNANIQGLDAVSSMVVFEQGRPNKQAYRRFRVKTVEGADDFATMREVITRRFMRAREELDSGESGKFTPLPDLILIDGGKGQLGAALGAMEDCGFSIPMIALAERLEEIYVPDEKAPLILQRSDPALHLLQRIRDEAHRFAITYHRSLRSKTALLSVLSEIDGIGPKRQKALFKAFVTLDEIKNAPLEALTQAKGMNAPAARSVYAYFHPSETD